jgi:large subunit ribosomal protein L23
MDGPLKIIKFGKKEIYLYEHTLRKTRKNHLLIYECRPKFTVALIRTPRLSPYHAKFQVPLSFSKYDLRDYLFHAYNIRALSIRSSVAQQPIRDSMEAPRQWFRPEAKKYMTIEMDKPFVWPKEPESWEPWGKEQKEKGEKDSVNEMQAGAEKKREAAQVLRKQAAGLLRGEGSGTEKGRVLEEWEKRRTGKFISGDEGEFKIRV